jgi:hypothetical protein
LNGDTPFQSLLLSWRGRGNIACVDQSLTDFKVGFVEGGVEFSASVGFVLAGCVDTLGGEGCRGEGGDDEGGNPAESTGVLAKGRKREEIRGILGI